MNVLKPPEKHTCFIEKCGTSIVSCHSSHEISITFFLRESFFHAEREGWVWTAAFIAELQQKAGPNMSSGPWNGTGFQTLLEEDQQAQEGSDGSKEVTQF